MIEVDLMVWVTEDPGSVGYSIGHVPGTKRVELPTVPRVGDTVSIGEFDEGTVVERVVLIAGNPVPIVIIEDSGPRAAFREIITHWINHGFEFDDCADKYLNESAQ